MIVVFADCFEPCARIRAIGVACFDLKYNMNFNKSQYEIRKIHKLVSYCSISNSLGCIQNGLTMYLEDSAGRVGPGGAVPRRSVFTGGSHQTRLAARTVSRPSGLCAHEPLGLDTGLAAVVANWESRMLKLTDGRSPPDPTRPALAFRYSIKPILNSPDLLGVPDGCPRTRA